MSTSNGKPQTRITPVIPPDAHFLVRFWYKYFVFQAVYWRFAMFVLLVVSAILLWPYAAIITGGNVSIPVQTMESSEEFTIGHNASLIVIADKYAVPGSPVKFQVYLNDQTTKAENTKVVFKAIPTSANTPFSIGESVLQEGDTGVWQATSILSLTIPQNYDEQDYVLKIQAQIYPEESNVPMQLELDDVTIPVVRWP